MNDPITGGMQNDDLVRSFTWGDRYSLRKISKLDPSTLTHYCLTSRGVAALYGVRQTTVYSYIYRGKKDPQANGGYGMRRTLPALFITPVEHIPKSQRERPRKRVRWCMMDCLVFASQTGIHIHANADPRFPALINEALLQLSARLTTEGK